MSNGFLQESLIKLNEYEWIDMNGKNDFFVNSLNRWTDMNGTNHNNSRYPYLKMDRIKLIFGFNDVFNSMISLYNCIFMDNNATRCR